MQNIIRVHEKKFKSKGHITAAILHNLRIHLDHNLEERIYAEKTHLNEVVYNPMGVSLEVGSDFQHKLFEKYDELGIKFKPDNVYMLEFMISASPEFFETSTPEQIADWHKCQLEFAKEQFGDNLKLMVLHEDESTPHYHLFVSTEAKYEKKYKNRHGTCFKTTWSLNAKRFNPEFLTSMHDAHAAKNEHLGLLRGVEGSSAEHVTLKAYTKRLKRVLGKNYIEVLAGKLDRIFQAKSPDGEFVPVETAKKVLTHFINELKLDMDCLKFHIDDRKKREKMLKVESERLKKKEAEMDALLDNYLNTLQSKNSFIDDLEAKNELLSQANEKLTTENLAQALQIVDYQNKVKALEKKLEHK